MVLRHSTKISLLSLALVSCLAACGGSADATSSASATPSAKAATTSGPEKPGSAATTATSNSSSSEGAAAGGPGATLTITDAHEAARSAPESVDSKKVRVKGVVAKIITQTAGSKSTYNVKLTPSATETEPVIRCDFGSSAPSVSEGANVTFECTGRIPKSAPKSAPLELKDCAIVP